MAKSACLGFWLCAALAAQEREPQRIEVPFQRSPIEIDGKLGEWQQATPLRFDRAEQVYSHSAAGKWGGPADLSATFYLSYDAAHLYLAGHIVDDSLVRSGPHWYEADAVEVFLDLDLTDQSSSYVFDDDDVQLFLMPLNRQRPWGLQDYGNRDAAKPRGSAMTGVRVVCDERSDGYDFEAVIPFHNFPALQQGVHEIGFALAIDDHDEGLDRYQYMTSNGKRAVDDTRNLDRLVFADSAPLEDVAADGGGLSQRILDALPFVLLPPLVMLLLAMCLRAWGAATRRLPVLKPIGRLVGVLLFVLGLVLPGALVSWRDQRGRSRAEDAGARLVRELSTMERGNMVSYPGGQIDAPLIDLLAGREVDRVDSFSYRSLASLLPGGFGNSPKSYPNEGFSVLPYWVPLPLQQLERFDFQEPLRGQYLNIVISTPPVVDSELPAQVRLTLGRASGVSKDVVLDLDGIVEPGTFVNRPELGVTFKQVELAVPVSWVGLTALSGQGLRLVGLTLLPDLDQPPRPLRLGLPSLTGVETDLRGPFPEDLGVVLTPGRVHRVELENAPVEGFEKLWLFYRAEYPASGEVFIGRDAKVCEVELQLDGAEPSERLIELRHQTSMFFGVAKFNGETTPPDPAASIAFSWQDAEQERYVTLGYEVDLPADKKVRAIEFRNVGPYDVRFRSVVFGAARRNLLVEPEESALEYPGDARKLRMKRDRLAPFAGSDFAVYRNGTLAATTLTAAAVASRANLPRRIERELSTGAPQTRVVDDGDRRTYEAYVPLPGAWSGGVLAILIDDAGFGAFSRWWYLIGTVVCLLAAPVLLLLFSELLTVFNSLRLRLIAVFSVAMLVPLALLSLVLVRVLEDGHESDLREVMRQGMSAATERLHAEEQRLVESAETWLQTLAAEVDAVPAAELATPEHRDALRKRLQATMSSQLPPAWEGGFLRFEFEPRQGTKLEPFSVFEGDAALEAADAPLRTNPGVHLAWGSAFFGVRRGREVADLGTCSLSVARPQDHGLLGGLAPGRGVVLTDSKGYPLASVGGGDIDAGALALAGRQPGAMAERRQALASVLESGQPVVRRDAADGDPCIAVYDVLRDQQDTPRILLALVDRDRPATVPLGLGRVPVRAFFLAGAGLLLLLSVFLSFVVTARISKPIEQLEAGALALGSGNLHVAIESEEGGQIGRLTRSFNQMAQDLRSRIQDLHDLNRGVHELTSKLDLEEAVATAAAFFARHSDAARVRILLRERDRVVVVGDDSTVLDARAVDVAALLEAEGPMSLPLGRPASAAGVLAAAFPGFGAALALPLVQAGRTRGSIVLLFEGPHPPAVNLELLATMTSHAAVAIANARVYQHAVEDAETGAYVADYLRRLVIEAVGRAQETGSSVALLALTLADGEATAQALGVSGWRGALERWARALRSALPHGAALGRCEYGFRVLLSGADSQAAREMLAALPAPADAGLGRVDRAAAVYPEDGASAEFLFDALDRRSTGDASSALSVDFDQLREQGIVLHSPAMQDVLRRIERVAPTDLSVLIEGETGTGKEVLTDLIHRWSRRAQGPLVKVHCAALSESLLQSELFGHEKGAFTGAVARKIGKFEQAQGGTIFLDEIGEVSLDVQVKLLRVLQEHEIDVVGGLHPIPVDVRVLAATNRDIRAMVERGEFREDLYYRLQGMVLHVPPLRERKQEIPALLEVFRRQVREAGDTQAEGFTADALDELYRRDWPGNVRELRNTVARALVLATGRFVTRDDVLGLLSDPPGPVPADPLVPSVAPDRDRHRVLCELLQKRGSIATHEYVAVAGISSRTGLRDLAELVDRGLVRRVGKRRGARYHWVAKAAGEKGATTDE